MDKKRTIPNVLFFEAVENLLKRNVNVAFRVKGGSMRPFLWEGDTVRVTSVLPEKLKKWDIVLAYTDFGILLHRVVRIREDKIILAGDANRRLEYTDRKKIIGMVDAAWRGERALNINDYPKLLLVRFWYGLRPFRGHLLGMYERYRKIRRNR